MPGALVGELTVSIINLYKSVLVNDPSGTDKLKVCVVETCKIPFTPGGITKSVPFLIYVGYVYAQDFCSIL